MSSERDALDLITSVGWARKLSRGMSLGVEAIGEDLEGFWKAEEREGGARLLAGPGLHISPAAQATRSKSHCQSRSSVLPELISACNLDQSRPFRGRKVSRKCASHSLSVDRSTRSVARAGARSFVV